MRPFLAAVSLLAVLLALVASLLFRGGAAAATWNLLLVTLDTTRSDHLGCYGYRHAETPAIDALCRQGVRYDRCYAPAPITLPSHASILTGLYPPRHGVRINGEQSLSPAARTLAEILLGEGYATAAVVGSFVLDRRFGLAQGFEHFDDNLSSGTEPDLFHFPERSAEKVTDAALAWLRRPRDRAFFLWVHYFDPHEPYSPPGYRPELAARIGYDEEISYVDRHLSRVLEELEQRGGRPTLVVLTADHGEALGEHGEYTHGLFTYEGTLRVPLIVRFPDGRRGGTALKRPVALVDLVPSVLEWLGFDPPDDLDGVPLPASDRAPAEDGRAIYFENRSPAHMYGWSALAGLVAGGGKYIRAPRPELYDVLEDPYERENRLPADFDRAKELADRLSRLEATWTNLGALESPSPSPSDEAVDRLASLGYVARAGTAPPGSPPRTVSGADPKDMLPVYHQIQLAMSFLERNRPLPAMERLVRLVATDDPTNETALLILANAVAQVDAELAGPDREEAAVHWHLGEAHRALGDASRARAAYQRAVDLAGREPNPPPWLSEASERLEALRTPQ